MDLSKSPNPLRHIQWNGKSLAICSRKELIECILYMSRQALIAERQSVAAVQAAEQGKTAAEMKKMMVEAANGPAKRTVHAEIK